MAVLLDSTVSQIVGNFHPENLCGETCIDLTVGTDFKDCVYPIRLFIEWSVEFLHTAFT